MRCPSHVQPSQPEDIPGEDKHLGSRLRGAAEGALQAFAPVRGIHQHVRSPCRFSYALNPPIWFDMLLVDRPLAAAGLSGRSQLPSWIELSMLLFCRLRLVT